MSNRSRFVCAALLSLLLAACGDDTNPTGGTGGNNSGGGGEGGEGAGGSEPVAPYSVPVFDAVRINSHDDQPNFQAATEEFELHDGPFSSVTLVVDLASTCFPFESWTAPPEGENWPADCDAFDRNFEFLVDSPLAEGDPPAIELVRAITPFGGPMHLEIDVTDVANGLAAGPHRLKTAIATWSDGAGQVSGSNGGWNVTARFEVTPGAPPRSVLAVIPLFDGSQTTPEGAPVTFTVPEGATSGRIEYRVTGHGGGDGDGACIGPAEEFCKRDHTLTLDGEVLEVITPWRTDCKDLCTLTHYGPESAGFDYCLENPCGAIQSVRAPRANWCPGSVTPPFAWDVPALSEPGTHELAWNIPNLAEGGSWRISATYFAFGDP